jgi:glucosamine-6-phosphate deaminase
MRLEIFDSEAEVCEAAAAYIHSVLPDGAVLGVATGKTQIMLYQELAKLSLMKISKAFALDEYIGLTPGDKRSFTSYLRERVEKPLGLKAGSIRVPNGVAAQPDREAQRFEQEILDSPIDLQILGVGSNGHIAFNEPGSVPAATTQVVKLSMETRINNGQDFDGLAPEYAITQGIATILRANRLILIVTGEAKAKALAKLLAGVVDPGYPVTFIWGHPGLVVFADKAAMS